MPVGDVCLPPSRDLRADPFYRWKKEYAGDAARGEARERDPAARHKQGKWLGSSRTCPSDKVMLQDVVQTKF